jgi:hypothetical protein
MHSLHALVPKHSLQTPAARSRRRLARWGAVRYKRFMGRRFAFNIFLPDEALGALVGAVRPLLESEEDALYDANPNSRRQRTTLVIDGAEFALRCAYGFASNRRVVVSRDEPVEQELEFTMYFEPDDAIDAYQSALNQPDDYLGIGVVYGTIQRTPTISRMIFRAATSYMSELFQRSSSIRGTFVALAERCRANLVVLDLEGGEFETLEDPPRRAVVPIESWTEDGAWTEVDTPTLLASLEQALGRDEPQP